MFDKGNQYRGNKMIPKQFYDWQTVGGTDDVMRLVDCLERARPRMVRD